MLAYVGPGSGFAVAVSLLTVVIVVLSVVFGPILYPVLALWYWVRGKRVKFERGFKKVVVLPSGNGARRKGPGADQAVKTFGDLPLKEQVVQARSAQQQWGVRAVKWGQVACDRGDVQVAAACWSGALRSQSNPKDVESLIDDLMETASTSKADDRSAVVFKAIEAVSRNIQPESSAKYLKFRVTTLRRHTQLEKATSDYDNGRFDECLAALDALDKTLPEPEGMGDLTTGFMRVMSLVRLDRNPDAAALLAKMQSWPGDDEQHARVLFLAGWIRLQSDDKPEALAAFKRLVERYPGSSFGAKARDLIKSLE